MLGLPKATEMSKQLPKKAIYAKFQMNTAAKEKIDADISRITIVNEIAPNKVNIPAGDKVKNFFVLLVSLKRKEFDEKTIATLSKLIPQNILFVLECGSESKLAIYHTKIMQTDWKPTEEQRIELQGLNLDKVWENVVVAVGSVDIEQGNTLDEQIEVNEKRQKLEKEIAKFEKQARAEKQPKKKFELAGKVKNLKRELDMLSSPSKAMVAAMIGNETTETEAQSVNTVKAISILPEYAADIFDGLKTIEWRSWKTDYRGDLLICASTRKQKGCISGYALCMVELFDVVPFTRKHLNSALMDSVPEPAGYAWLLKNVRLIKPFPYKGKLHLYDVDASLVEVLSPIHTNEADIEFEQYYKQLYIEAGAEF